MFCDEAFSACPTDALRADSSALAELSEQSLLGGFQVSAENPLLGAQGRRALLQRLGRTVMNAYVC